MVRWCLNNQTSHTRLGQLRSRKETHVATKEQPQRTSTTESIGILLQRAAERCIVDASERIEAGPMSHATLELPGGVYNRVPARYRAAAAVAAPEDFLGIEAS